jgi:hypothetical protein
VILAFAILCLVLYVALVRKPVPNEA